MRRWKDLSAEEKKRALELSWVSWMQAILDGFTFGPDYGDVDRVIQEAFTEANRMGTPWFAHEYIHERRFTPPEDWETDNDGRISVSELLEIMAEVDTEQAWYPEWHEVVIRLPGKGAE